MYVNHETFDDADRHLHALSGWDPDRLFRRLRVLQRIGAVLAVAERGSIEGLWCWHIVCIRACHDCADLHAQPSGAQPVFRQCPEPARPKHRVDIGEANATYAATPFLQSAWPIYNIAKVDVGSSTRFHQANLHASCALSKRTALYGAAIMQKAAGAGLGVDPATGAPVNHAQIPNLPDSNSDRQRSVTLGIRHSF